MASSQETRFHFPSPREPIRFRGCKSLLGWANDFGAKAPFMHNTSFKSG